MKRLSLTNSLHFWFKCRQIY